MTLARGQALVRLVHDIQPDCLVNSRVTGEEPNPGDYRSMGDNQFPAGRLDVPWETAGTLSASWSFREGEQNWKSPKHVIENLAANVSKGGNYLLNIGPTWEGVMPEPGAERLREVGRWLKVNGEAVYGAQPSPLRSPPDWGVITAKPGRLYLHVFDWPHKEIVLYGLRSKALKARLLADQTAVPVSQRHDPATDHHALILTLPTAAPDERDTVIAVETDGGPDVDAGLLQRPDGRIDLDAIHAKLDPRAANSRMHIAERGDGFVQGWLDSRDSVSWSVNVVRPGVFDVRIVTAKWSRKSGNDRVLDWEGGHAVVLSAGEERVSGVIEDNGVVSPPRFLRAEGVRSNLGRISIGKPGMCDITLRAERIERAKKLGFLLWRVVLIPASGS
jgi:alpha-L-fucosidase